MKNIALSIFTKILALCAGMLLLIAALSLIVTIFALISRMQYGRGLLFADVEFFGLIAFFCALFGGLAILGIKRLSKRYQANVK